MITLFNYLLIFNIFAGAFVLVTPYFEFYLGYVFIIIFLIIYILRYQNLSINSRFLALLTALMFFSLVNVYYQNTTIALMSKQLAGIGLTGTAYYLLVKVNKYDIDRLFRIYLQFVIIAAVIGVFQEFSYLTGFHIGYDYRYLIPKWGITPTSFGMLKVNSIFEEPSHLAITLAPALFVALMTVLRNNDHYLSKKAGVLIIITILLTFSAIAYLEVLLCLFFIFTNIKKSVRIFIVLLIPFFIYMTYVNVPDIRMRIDDSAAVITGSKKVVDANLSTYALASNAFVAYKSFTDDPWFGHGLGSHPVSYDRYLHLGITNGFWQESAIVLNREDANSLFLRLISETGLLGTLAVLYFIFKFRLKINDRTDLRILNNGILILFLVSLLRQGHYFYDGLFFFVWLYYFSYKIHNKSFNITEPENC